MCWKPYKIYKPHKEAILFLSLLDGPLNGPADILAIGLYLALQKNPSLSVEKFIKDMAGGGTGNLDPNKWGNRYGKNNY